MLRRAHRRGSKRVNHRSRCLRYEALEDRRMLTKADIVFVMDESGSEETTHHWVTALVTGDTNNDGQQDIASLGERLAADGIDDI
jgi:hypothetical protein